ncbi:MAG TPA: hypothetical protein VGC36_14820, partial [Rhizomicrobium sp.]
MADYYPLIARAVAGLDKNTGENRRALYDRARAALVNQLRGVDPPLDESDITRERLALEEAIRKLEVEAAKRQRPDSPEFDDKDHSLRDQGLRDFRDTVAEAQGLGDASAESSRSARAAYDDMRSEVAADHGHDHDREHYFEPPPGDQPGVSPDMPADGDAAHAHHAPDADRDAVDGTARAGWRGQTVPHDDDVAYSRPLRSYGRIVKIAVLLLLVGAVAAGAFWQRSAIVKMATSAMTALRGSSAPTTPKPSAATEPAGRPKITDRIGANNGPSSSATSPAAAVAQKVVLYDEDPTDPKGKRYVGSAVWRTETVSPGPGLAPEFA